MQDKSYRIIHLIQRYLTGNLSFNEVEELEIWFSEKKGREQWFDDICKGYGATERYTFYKSLDAEGAYLRFKKNTQSRNIHRKQYLNYAAVAILLLAVGSFFFLRKPNDIPFNKVGEVESSKYYKAYLTLSSGEKLVLTAGDSSRVLQTGVKVVAVGNSISCNSEGNSRLETNYNTLSTPRGGEYGICLCDSSWIHLNASTELQFPKTFCRDERVVKLLSGEAFFQIAKDDQRPFFVEVNNIRIRVYGTQFNINVKSDGEIETVLVEGSVDIENDHTKLCKMKPGQLSLVSTDGSLLALQDVDVELYISWTKGVYLFDEVSLELLMSQLSLWYDIDVTFKEPELKKFQITGRFEKYQSIESILNSLKYITGYDFHYDNRQIIISK